MADKIEPPDLSPPPPGEAVLPLPRNLSARQWACRGAVWAGLLALMGLLIFWWDLPLMRWRLEHLPGRKEGFNWWNQTLYGLRDFGQVLPIVVAMIIVARCDRRRWFIIAGILLAQLLASAGYNSSKYALSRYRPCMLQSPAGEKIQTTRDTWLGWQPQIDDREYRWNEDYRSFPSGHSSAAFAFAGVLVWFYPRLKVLFWALAVGCAFTRVYDVLHWPGDCLAGGMVGYLSAYVALRPYIWALPVIWYRRRVIAKRSTAR